MTTILSGTNRPDSRTLKIANAYREILEKLGQEARVLDLRTLEHDFFKQEMYHPDEMTAHFARTQEQWFFDVERFVFVVPEYNGSYPGVVKLFLDAMSVRDYDRMLMNKPVALVGVSTGRAGNLRGIDHLADVIAHLGGWVVPNKLPISSVQTLLDENGKLTHNETIAALRSQAQQLISAPILQKLTH